MLKKRVYVEKITLEQARVCQMVCILIWPKTAPIWFRFPLCLSIFVSHLRFKNSLLLSQKHKDLEIEYLFMKLISFTNHTRSSSPVVLSGSATRTAPSTSNLRAGQQGSYFLSPLQSQSSIIFSDCERGILKSADSSSRILTPEMV